MLVECLHISIAITKLSGINVFICIISSVERCRTITHLSNHIPRSEGYNRLSCLPVCVCICTPQTWYVISTFIARLKTEWEWKVLLLYYYALCTGNISSAVNETWGNLTALHSTLHQRRLSSYSLLASALPVQVHVFWGRCGFGEWFAGRMGSYVFKA